VAVRRAIVTTAGLFALSGVLLRLWEFGEYGFWNDEAWVALTTRVAGYRQFLVALSSTPLAWALLLQPLAVLPHPEVALRVLALAFSCVTLWLAWMLGGRLAGHPVGGVFAVGLVALDPASIQYAKQLKQYSAETALMLGTLWLTTMLAAGRSPLWLLVVALVGGLTLSNAQILTAPAVVLALVVSSEARARVGSARLIAAAAFVGACCVTYYVLRVRLWSNGAMHAFWTSHYLPTDIRGALAGAVEGFRTILAPGLGPWAVELSIAGMALLMLARSARPATLAVVLVAGEMVLLAVFQLLPIGVARTSLFLTNAILVMVGAAAARCVVALWHHRSLRPTAPIAVLAFGAMVLHGHPWATMAKVQAPEDLGPLVKAVEAGRRPGDRILVYDRSPYVWSYYQRATPVVQPFDRVSVGFFPVLEDPDVALVDGDTIHGAIGDALATGRTVWFVGSRFLGSDRAQIRTEIRSRMRVVDEQRRKHALMLRGLPPERNVPALGGPGSNG
jgi:hypothetical protein